MPRIIDGDVRRADIGEAMWRVIVREGLDHASVRSVAREAELSVGSLRHYFGTQVDLLAYALAMVGDRLEARLTTAGATGPALERVRAKIAEMLPVDADRRTECEVWLAFTARALVDTSLHEAQAEVERRLAEAFTFLIGLLADAGLLHEQADRQIEAVRLSALVDGLILRGLVGNADPGELLEVVDAHLAEITRG